MAKFVLIGGGENGREGTTYETENIDKEIVEITNKKKPNFLFLAHGNSYEESYYSVMRNIYENKFDCMCDMLTKEEVFFPSIANEKLKRADIIYVGGGNTLKMINIWKKSGFNNILMKYIDEDKVFCGISAGAICWCKYGLSDSRKFTSNSDKYIKVSGLNIFEILFCPSYDENLNKQESLKKVMERTYKIPAIACEKGSAIVIENNQYKLIRSLENKHIYKSFYKNGEYFHKDMKIDNKFHKLENLMQKI